MTKQNDVNDIDENELTRLFRAQLKTTRDLIDEQLTRDIACDDLFNDVHNACMLLSIMCDIQYHNDVARLREFITTNDVLQNFACDAICDELYEYIHDDDDA